MLQRLVIPGMCIKKIYLFSHVTSCEGKNDLRKGQMIQNDISVTEHTPNKRQDTSEYFIECLNHEVFPTHKDKHEYMIVLSSITTQIEFELFG